MINGSKLPRRALIAWLAPDGAPPERRVYDAAAAAGYKVITGIEASGNSARAIDVAVADLRFYSRPGKSTAALLAAARSLSPRAGLVTAASTAADRTMRGALRRHADVSYVGADAAPVIGAVRDRLRLASLADETGERIKSLVAEGRSISFEALREQPGALSFLVAGRPSPLTLSACNSVRRVARQTSCVFNAGQVMRALDHAKFDCAIFQPANETDLLIALARALRRHRDHRTVSIFIASDDEELLERCAERDGFETILADHIDADLAPRAETVVRRARMASAMRAFLRSGEGAAANQDGAATARFFASHATRVMRIADDRGQPVSMAALSLEPGSADGLKPAAMTEAVRTASKLVRAEDMIVRLTPATLLVLLRNVAASDAEAVAARLEGVIAGTLLRSPHNVAGVAAAAIERAPGDALETPIAALIAALRQPSKRSSIAI